MIAFVLLSFPVRHKSPSRPGGYRPHVLPRGHGRPTIRRRGRPSRKAPLQEPSDLRPPKAIRHPLLLEPCQIPMPVRRRDQKCKQQMDRHAAPAYADDHDERLFFRFGRWLTSCLVQGSCAPGNSSCRTARRTSRIGQAACAATQPRSRL